MFTNLRVICSHRILLDYLLSNCHSNAFIREQSRTTVSHIITVPFVLQNVSIKNSMHDEWHRLVRTENQAARTSLRH